MTTLPSPETTRIAHNLLPGFVMDVLDTRECETSGTRPEPHSSFKVVDPDGNEDWLCAYDVRAASTNSSATLH